MLKTLSVDLRIDNVNYKDQLEWDMNNTLNCPENFAELTANEMGIGFAPRISHSLRESVS